MTPTTHPSPKPTAASPNHARTRRVATRRSTTILLLLASLVVNGCRSSESEHGHDESDAHREHADEPGAPLRSDDHHDSTGGRSVEDAASLGETAGRRIDHRAPADATGDGDRVPLAGVRGVSFDVVSPPVEEGVWYPGEAMASEDERAMLTSPIEGIVAAIRVPPGREVPAGTPLVTVRSPELAALSAALLTSSATRRQAASEVAREERLAASGAGAPRELDAARTALAVAEAEEAAARLALESRGIDASHAGASLEVRAPYRGRVASLEVVVGEGVSSGQRLGMFETARASLVRLELPLPGPSTWTPGVTTTARRGDGKTWPLRVEGLPGSLSPQTRRLTYRLRLEGGAEAELPYPGTPVEVRVPLPSGIVVPQDAVQQIEGQWGVFVVAGDDARFQPIRRGPELGGDVIVLEGLAPGERIAIEGAYLLKALALKRSGGGEAHAH
jgi:cobalt-zinc-cadmium efflux system membrane fusion protein